MNKKLIALSVLLIAVVVISGCTTRESSSTATSSQGESAQQIAEKKQMEILSTATHASVVYVSKNWDADAEDDGVVIYPELRDANDTTVKFEDIKLNVDIKIWTSKFEDFKEAKDKLIYSGTGTIDSWKDGNLFFGGGIKVTFEDIKATASDSEYGMLFVKIGTPTGKTFEAKSDVGVRIKP